ncbi:MAG: methionyl-tRNA formyltransferase [Planctomycetota bacterium]
MKLILLASGAFAVPTLRSLHGSGRHEVVCVVTQPERGSGRGRKPTPTPVSQWALKLGLEVIEAQDVNDLAVVAHLQGYAAALGLVIAFGQKLGAELLAVFPLGCVNLHASLLPKFRGAAPVQWAILTGEERTGVTVFRLSNRMDAGPILTTRWTLIKPEETAAELHDRLAQIGPDAVQAALELHAGGQIPPGQPQAEEQASKAPKLTKQHGHLDFAQQARVLANRVCGLWDWPGATCVFMSAASGRRERVTLARARVAEAGGPPTTPGLLDPRLYVAAADGFLELLEIQPESGRLMTWPAFINGRHVTAGDRFEAVG